FGALVIPPLVREIKQLASDIPGYVNRLKSSNGFFADLERKYHLSSRLKDVTAKLPSLASTSFSTIFGFTKSIASIIFNMLTIAIWVAIRDLLPAVGATPGALAAVIVAAFSSWGAAIATAAYFIAYQQIENYLIVPRVMRHSVDLSPAAVIVSVLIGGSLEG